MKRGEKLNIQSLKQKLRELDSTKLNSVKVSFIEKRKNGATSYIPEITKKLRESIINRYLEILEEGTFENEQQAYNEFGKEDDTLEIANLEVGNIQTIIDIIYKQENCEHDLSEMKIDKINYYVICFKKDEEEIYFFKRFNKQKRLRRGIRGWFIGNNFTQLEEEVIGIGDDVDIIVYSDEALIINRFALQTIFDLSDYFLGRTDQAMRVIEGYKKINNFESFEEDCKNDGTAIKRLTRIVNTPNLISGFFSNFDNLPYVIKECSLTITIDEDGVIDYKGTREERTQILSCMADKYYITLLQGKTGEDKLK